MRRGRGDAAAARRVLGVVHLDAEQAGVDERGDVLLRDHPLRPRGARMREHRHAAAARIRATPSRGGRGVVRLDVAAPRVQHAGEGGAPVRLDPERDQRVRDVRPPHGAPGCGLRDHVVPGDRVVGGDRLDDAPRAVAAGGADALGLGDQSGLVGVDRGSRACARSANPCGWTARCRGADRCRPGVRVEIASAQPAVESWSVIASPASPASAACGRPLPAPPCRRRRSSGCAGRTVRAPPRANRRSARGPASRGPPIRPRRSVSLRAPPARRDPRRARAHGGARARRVAAAARAAARAGPALAVSFRGAAALVAAVVVAVVLTAIGLVLHRLRRGLGVLALLLVAFAVAEGGVLLSRGIGAPDVPVAAAERRHGAQLEHARRLGARAGDRPGGGGEPRDRPHAPGDDRRPRPPGRAAARGERLPLHGVLDLAAGGDPVAVDLAARQHVARRLPAGHRPRRHPRGAERRRRPVRRPERAADRRRAHDGAVRAGPGRLAPRPRLGRRALLRAERADRRRLQRDDRPPRRASARARASCARAATRRSRRATRRSAPGRRACPR